MPAEFKLSLDAHFTFPKTLQTHTLERYHNHTAHLIHIRLLITACQLTEGRMHISSRHRRRIKLLLIDAQTRKATIPGSLRHTYNNKPRRMHRDGAHCTPTAAPDSSQCLPYALLSQLYAFAYGHLFADGNDSLVKPSRSWLWLERRQRDKARNRIICVCILLRNYVHDSVLCM
ncbi:hypothetical protein JTB14_032131 [Gonioctena quinquepunctata]|nr:hypothetical protein JTB14_032131 [Gonioctena quinquepunctata]